MLPGGILNLGTSSEFIIHCQFYTMSTTLEFTDLLWENGNGNEELGNISANAPVSANSILNKRLNHILSFLYGWWVIFVANTQLMFE